MSHTFQIAPAAYGFGRIIVLGVILLGSLLGSVLVGGSTLLNGSITALLLSVVTLLGYTAYSMHNLRLEIEADTMRIRGDLYGRTLPVEALRPDQAQVVDLRDTSELRPRCRTNGIGVPGYRAGWFRLANGERALLYVTDESMVTYLPTTEGYGLLLSVDEPHELLGALRRAKRAPAA